MFLPKRYPKMDHGDQRVLHDTTEQLGRYVQLLADQSINQ